MAMISLLAEGHADQLFGSGQEKIDRRLRTTPVGSLPETRLKQRPER